MPDTKLQPPFPAYGGSKPFIFVSYAHKDAADVFPELCRLHGLGYRIWFDEGIDPGNEWPEEIAKALGNAAHFIVFITPDAVKSRNVRNEIRFALTKGKPFLAVHLRETALPEGLELDIGSVQAVYMHKLSAQNYERKMEQTLPVSVRENAASRPQNRPGLKASEKRSGKLGSVLSVLTELISPSKENDFFPLFGVSLGRTTFVELKKLAHKKLTFVEPWEDVGCFTINGYDFWTKQYVANWMKINPGAPFPEQWKSLGFNWGHSQDEWVAVLKRLGHSVEVSSRRLVGSSIPRSKRGQYGRHGPPWIQTTLKARKQTKIPIELTLEFFYEEGKSPKVSTETFRLDYCDQQKAT